jgi:hypothetical protein
VKIKQTAREVFTEVQSKLSSTTVNFGAFDVSIPAGSLRLGKLVASRNPDGTFDVTIPVLYALPVPCQGDLSRCQ